MLEILSRKRPTLTLLREFNKSFAVATTRHDVISTNPTVLICTINKGCPPALIDLMLSCLDHNPQKRPQFTTILQHLQAVHGNLPREDLGMCCLIERACVL